MQIDHFGEFLMVGANRGFGGGSMLSAGWEAIESLRNLRPISQADIVNGDMAALLGEGLASNIISPELAVAITDRAYRR